MLAAPLQRVQARSGSAARPTCPDAETDANAAFFDAAHGFAGCIAGLDEVPRRQGQFEGILCLYASEDLSPGQID